LCHSLGLKESASAGRTGVNIQILHGTILEILFTSLNIFILLKKATYRGIELLSFFYVLPHSIPSVEECDATTASFIVLRRAQKKLRVKKRPAMLQAFISSY